MVDLSRQLVPEGNVIPIRTNGTVDSLPCLQLIAGSTVAAEHGLETAELPIGHEHLPFRGALAGELESGERPGGLRVRVAVLVDVGQLIPAECDRIGL